MERWWIDNYELTQANMGWEVREGTDEWGGLVGGNAQLAGRDGELWRRKSLAAGTVTLSLWLRGANQANVRALWGELLRVAGRRNRTMLLKRELSDGELVYARVSLTGAAKPVHLGQVGIRAQLTFTVPAGKWWNNTPYTYTTPGGVAATLDMPELAPATAPMLARYEITGPCTQFVLEDMSDPYASATDREKFIYTGSVPAGTTFTLLPETWSFTSSTATKPDLAKCRFTGRRWFEIEPSPPGQVPKVKFGFSGGSSATKLTVVARRWYVV